MKTLHILVFIIYFVAAIVGIFVYKDPAFSIACLAMAGVERLELKYE